MRRRIIAWLGWTSVRASLALLLLGGLSPAPTQAQLAQYIPPGTTSERPGDEKEALDLRLEEALWKLGALRLDPWIGITNAAVVVNTFGTPNSVEQRRDTTMTFGAGVLGIVPFGSKTYLTLDFVPQYVWWVEQSDRNTFNQWYGARVHGFYNHLYLETGASRRDAVRIRSSEADAEVNTRFDVADLLAELRLGETIHLFGSTSFAKIRSLEEDRGGPVPDYSSQDRDEAAHRLGVRYKPQATSFIGVGVEFSDVEFIDPLRDRSNKGSSPLVQFEHQAPEFFLTGEAVFRDLEPEGETSGFVPYDGITGFVQLSYEPGWRMTYTPYYRTNLFYSLQEDYSYYDATRIGLKVGAKLSERWSVSVYGESGADDYTRIEAITLDREDDFTSFGIDFNVQISKVLGLRIGYSIDDWDSNLDEFDRDNGRLRLGFNTGLTLGRR